MSLEIADEDQMEEVHIFTIRKQCAQEVKFISIFSNKKKPNVLEGKVYQYFQLKNQCYCTRGSAASH